MNLNPFEKLGDMFADVFTPVELRERYNRILAHTAMGPEGDKVALAGDWETVGNDMERVLDSLSWQVSDHLDSLESKEE